MVRYQCLFTTVLVFIYYVISVCLLRYKCLFITISSSFLWFKRIAKDITINIFRPFNIHSLYSSDCFAIFAYRPFVLDVSSCFFK